MGNTFYLLFQQIKKTLDKWSTAPISNRQDFQEISIFITTLREKLEKTKNTCDGQAKNIDEIMISFIPEIVLYREFNR